MIQALGSTLHFEIQKKERIAIRMEAILFINWLRKLTAVIIKKYRCH